MHLHYGAKVQQVQHEHTPDLCSPLADEVIALCSSKDQNGLLKKASF